MGDLIALVKKPNEWIVNQFTAEKNISVSFSTIELAADHMESLGIQDQEIDYALCELALHRGVEAIFGTNGKYSHLMVE